MSKGKVRLPATKPRGELSRLATEANPRTAPGMANDFNILPGNPMAKTGSNGLHSGLLGGKPSRQTFSEVELGKAVFDLCRGENPGQKTVSKALHGGLDPGHFGDVNSCPYNHLDALPRYHMEVVRVSTRMNHFMRDKLWMVHGIICLRFFEALYSSTALPATCLHYLEEKRKFRNKECVQHNGTRNS